MLQTFVAPFDFHHPRGGRGEFEKTSCKFRAAIQRASQHHRRSHFFRMAATAPMAFSRLSKLDASRPAIVYLSNIVMH